MKSDSRKRDLCFVSIFNYLVFIEYLKVLWVVRAGLRRYLGIAEYP